VGYDARLSGPDLALTVEETLTKNGVDVMALGSVATEELYFATASLKLDGGIMITASHNPAGGQWIQTGAKRRAPDQLRHGPS